MNKKKAILCFLSMMIFVGLFSTRAAAWTVILKQFTKTTYAKYNHEEKGRYGYFDDEYHTFVSVRGIDRINHRGIKGGYPAAMQITVNVQGKKTVNATVSMGPKDYVQREKKKIVYDEWNLGPKTTIFWTCAVMKADAKVYPFNNELEK